VYRVKLVANATGFENKFSPEYEIRAEPDLVPQIELQEPKRDHEDGRGDSDRRALLSREIFPSCPGRFEWCAI